MAQSCPVLSPPRGSRSICHLKYPVAAISELLTGFLQSKEILLVPAINEELTSWLLIMQRNTLWNFHSCLLGWFVRLVNALKIYSSPCRKWGHKLFLPHSLSVCDWTGLSPRQWGHRGGEVNIQEQSWWCLVRKQVCYNFGVVSLIHIIGKQIQEVSGFFLSFIIILTLIISSNGVPSFQRSCYRISNVCLWSKVKIKSSPCCPWVISSVHVSLFPAWSFLS